MARSALIAHQSAATSTDDLISKLSTWADEVLDPQAQATARSVRAAAAAAEAAADEIGRTARHTRYATWAVVGFGAAFLTAVLWLDTR